MIAEEEAEQRFRKIDAAISEDIARRQRNRLVSWALLLVAAAVAIYVILAGRTETEIVAADLSSDEEFASGVAASEPVRVAIAEETSKLSNSEAFADQLLASPTLSRQIGTSVKSSVSELASTPGFRKSVEAIASDVSNDLVKEIKDNRSAIASFETRMLELSSGDGRTPPHGTGGQFDPQEISKLVAAQQATESRLRAEIVRLSKDVVELRTQLAESQSTSQGIDNSRTTTEAIGRSRSYLLRENADTALSDLNLSVTLGRKSNGTVEGIVFSDSRGPIESATKGSARIGESFVIVDREGRRFEATLTYDQGRFLAKDYVGLEMTSLRSTENE